MTADTGIVTHTPSETARLAGPTQPSALNDPKVRAIGYQLVLAIFVIAFGWWITGNVIENLRRANIASGFDFLSGRAGFEILFSLIPFSANESYGRAFFVGLLNTAYVSVIGIILATIIGFTVGIARLSPNFLLRSIATIYVEFFRNIPPLLQLLFWYKAVLALLPSPRAGFVLPGDIFLNNRGLILPKPVAEAGAGIVFAAAVLAIIAAIFVSRWATQRRVLTGATFPTVKVVLALLFGLPCLAFVIMGGPFTMDVPVLQGFNFRGGMVVAPEFMALLLGLSVYTGAFIAEIVRGGILAVSKGQTEAAGSLGLTRTQMLRLVIVPQAMRVIIPPLTNQYLNLTKNSSLAVAIGYPDLVAVFAGTVLNQTGQAIEVIAITMLVYLTMSLLTSALMNWFNLRMALVER
ncbi:amino acid ABC transporter permease [Flaviflagellibacter deserti]|jgi:general L-amino acid transport system permease protein|uniref:Amino acid ABC transporter permease n=1 Tax=Flaviflagellibacter deserti TaxID=2267266 RepID=A0ABV9Z6C2_9HYPH